MTRIVFIITGSKRPVPAAWMIRPVSSMPNSGAVAATMLPMRNNTIADKNILRVVNHCWSTAVTGTNTPITSIYAVVSHWMVEADTANSCMSWGRALLSKVSFKMATKAPMIRAKTIGHFLMLLRSILEP